MILGIMLIMIMMVILRITVINDGDLRDHGNDDDMTMKVIDHGGDDHEGDHGGNRVHKTAWW